ncbi:hypothetical protein GCM10010260_70570 [Streptomyces filipinensis]|uniref:Uncharacterized protein n=1 Tax=Streptomyces filipinensis TaxID=66887 RepID=A0A918MFE1_9ACTN|nr:hypothetical protein GCM10010260_70570 [Streptomyces filipinensis]
MGAAERLKGAKSSAVPGRIELASQAAGPAGLLGEEARRLVRVVPHSGPDEPSG